MGFFSSLSKWLNSLNDDIKHFNQRVEVETFNTKKEVYLQDNPDNPNPSVEEVERYWIEQDKKYEKIFNDYIKNEKKL